MNEVPATSSVVTLVGLHRAARVSRNSSEGRAWRIIELFDMDVPLARRMYLLLTDENRWQEISAVLGGGGSTPFRPHVAELLELVEGSGPKDNRDQLILIARQSQHWDASDPHLLAGVALSLHRGSLRGALRWLQPVTEDEEKEKVRQEAITILNRFC